VSGTVKKKKKEKALASKIRLSLSLVFSVLSPLPDASGAPLALSPNFSK
jgi:hypothetical protein